ncbi:unnamed protein product [Chrysodeixis includens]|uniref:Uncharacterized protein n=1 Tax=Chrysodeixis includens TaxID=689277 RepID=A0A9P0BP11_CHRIL|nr:unnamed protein product [Chrysodeixis includens]
MPRLMRIPTAMERDLRDRSRSMSAPAMFYAGDGRVRPTRPESLSSIQGRNFKDDLFEYDHDEDSKREELKKKRFKKNGSKKIQKASTSSTYSRDTLVIGNTTISRISVNKEPPPPPEIVIRAPRNNPYTQFLLNKLRPLHSVKCIIPGPPLSNKQRLKKNFDNNWAYMRTLNPPTSRTSELLSEHCDKKIERASSVPVCALPILSNQFSWEGKPYRMIQSMKDGSMESGLLLN